MSVDDVRNPPPRFGPYWGVPVRIASTSRPHRFEIRHAARSRLLSADRIVRVYLGLIAFSIAGSFLTATTGLAPGFVAPAASLVTLGCGLFLAIRPLLEGGRARLGAVLAVGFSAEVLGLYTGFPFGRYDYTAVWWPTVSFPGGEHFPLALPFAWLMITAACTLWVGNSLARPITALAAGFLAAFLDLFKEPVMTDVLGYWKWTDLSWPIGGPILGAPLLNAFGWALTAGIGAWVLSKTPPKPGAWRYGALVACAHLFLIGSLGIIAGWWWLGIPTVAALVGVVLSLRART